MQRRWLDGPHGDQPDHRTIDHVVIAMVAGRSEVPAASSLNPTAPVHATAARSTPTSLASASTPYTEATPIPVHRAISVRCKPSESSLITSGCLGTCRRLPTPVLPVQSRLRHALSLPFQQEGPEGEVIASDWAGGSLDAVALLMAPLFLLNGDMEIDDAADEDELLAQASDMIPTCIAGIHEFWRNYHKPAFCRGRRRPH